MHPNWIICNRLFVFPVLVILLFIVLFTIYDLFFYFDFYDRRLNIVLFDGYLFPLNLDDLDSTSKSKHQKFTKKNAFQNFWLIIVKPFHFLICFCFQKISQKNSGTKPLPPLINVAGCQNMRFFIYSISLLSQH